MIDGHRDGQEIFGSNDSTFPYGLYTTIDWLPVVFKLWRLFVDDRNIYDLKRPHRHEGQQQCFVWFQEAACRSFSAAKATAV